MSQSISMGYDAKGGARNRSSLYAAAGLEWPNDYMPEEEVPRYNDYPFCVDVSNNRLLASLDRSAFVRRAVVGVGSQDARGSDAPGVYTKKQLAYFDGRCGLRMSIDGRPLQQPSLNFEKGVVPVFCFCRHDVEVILRVFVPADYETKVSAVFLLAEVRNQSDSSHTLDIELDCEESCQSKWPDLAIDVTLITKDNPERSGSCQVSLDAGQMIQIGCICRFAVDVLPSPPVVTLEEMDCALGKVLESVGSQGVLEVPEEPWVGEELTRAAELARQSVLQLADGEVIGSFWGSNVNPKPDVWMRDFSYTAIGLVDTNPWLAYRCARYLCAASAPGEQWGTAEEGQAGESSYRHSLGNACMGAVVLSMIYRRYGYDFVNQPDSVIVDYLHQLAGCMIADRPDRGLLYATRFISDGLSRGDFHTGSNMLAWRAADALIEDFHALFENSTIETLSSIRSQLMETIETLCVGSFGQGEQFVEGAYANGDLVPIHDAEESDLALASVYGFTKRDDCRIINHMYWAHSIGNPYYARVSGGIDFWDFDGSNGVSYPGYLCLLKRTRNREDLRHAFAAIRRTTDLDGSFWWWPFKHDELDANRIKRGLGKCGWGGGEFVSLMLHDILGIQADAKTSSVSFAPYLPWHKASLTGFAFLDGTVDFVVDDEKLSLVNNTDHDIHARLQLCMPANSMLEDVKINDSSRRMEAQLVRLFDSSSVVLKEVVGPRKRVDMTIAIS
ncbi:hypothetical protein [Bifidobacterium asteroides]|uniref:hypothetical protein n=1 Tax=Bifidobacterium asteroides TaxID=1684 RepID=UPI003A806D61